MSSKSSNVRVLQAKAAEPVVDNINLINPVENLWEIELLYGRHHMFSEATYGLHMRSKLVGQGSRCFLLVDINPETIDAILYDLNVFGYIERRSMLRVIDYATQLKINGIFRVVPDLVPYIDGEAKDSEAEELFAQVKDYIKENIDLFPAVSTNMYDAAFHQGVELDVEQYTRKYGNNIVGVSTEAIVEALELDGSAKQRIVEITRAWQKLGVLVKKSSQARLQESIRPCDDSRGIKRFYLLHIENLHEA